MDLCSKDLFNGGDNDGDITIFTKDNQSIKCHSLIMRTTTKYFESMKNFNESKKETTINHTSKIVKWIINNLYTSYFEYDNKFDVYEIISLLKLIDELQIKFDISNTTKHYEKLFIQQINKENFSELLQITENINIFSSLYSALMDFSFYKHFIFEDVIKECDQEMMQKIKEDSCTRNLKKLIDKYNVKNLNFSIHKTTSYISKIYISGTCNNNVEFTKNLVLLLDKSMNIINNYDK